MADLKKLQLVKKILPRSTLNISRNLNPDVLLEIMQDKDALTPNEIILIKKPVLNNDKCGKLINTLMHKPLKSYEAFMDALLQIGRKEIYDGIVTLEKEYGYTSTRPKADQMIEEIFKKLDMVRKILPLSTINICTNLTPDPLLEIMQDRGALTPNEIILIKVPTLDNDKCGELINTLMRSPLNSYEVFKDALLQIGHETIYDSIIAIEKDVGYTKPGADGGGDTKRPLTSTSDAEALNSNKRQKVNPPVDEYMDVEPDSDGLYTSKEVKAARPTAKQLNSRDNYNMSTTEKGLAYILNNNHFPKREKKGRTRNGSHEDFENMKHLFKQLGYQIIPHENKKAEDIRESIRNFVSMLNDTEYMSAVIVLMSHGGKGYILGTDENAVKYKEIQAQFEGCLKGRPKLFFIQACRGTSIRSVVGDNVHDDANPSSSGSEDSDVEADDDFANNIPDDADMHFAYATPEDYYSLRNKRKGSWFIQAIAEVFLKHAHEENLDSLMNKVTKRVTGQKGNLYDPQTDRMVVAQQTPQCVKQMRKTMYFLPKYPPIYG